MRFSTGVCDVLPGLCSFFTPCPLFSLAILCWQDPTWPGRLLGSSIFSTLKATGRQCGATTC